MKNLKFRNIEICDITSEDGRKLKASWQRIYPTLIEIGVKLCFPEMKASAIPWWVKDTFAHLEQSSFVN